MHQYGKLINQLDSGDDETFWFGAVDHKSINILETLLSIRKLPDDLVGFLVTCGGGGVIDAEISGIESNDSTIEHGGTILFDTLYCRSEYDLPSDIIVIYFKNDEVCWCVDCSDREYGSVVSYNLFNRRIERKISARFFDFFKEYVELRTEIV